eukprot:CAMPEP_0114307952 /NCGR_PEP_ID=MMETSP0059-20121206/17770_1 /TAXON_ID=36894 /ORGANISM="Pyramimonas parkeae, Strain CCMP726" /LENGTH=125 /DNA_ID=CAMNT_0001431503 /DNA_START=615 /DNA_END=989 /DNA_ORIENTATION=+
MAQREDPPSHIASVPLPKPPNTSSVAEPVEHAITLLPPPSPSLPHQTASRGAAIRSKHAARGPRGAQRRRSGDPQPLSPRVSATVAPQGETPDVTSVLSEVLSDVLSDGEPAGDARAPPQAREPE